MIFVIKAKYGIMHKNVLNSLGQQNLAPTVLFPKDMDFVYRPALKFKKAPVKFTLIRGLKWAY